MRELEQLHHDGRAALGWKRCHPQLKLPQARPRLGERELHRLLEVRLERRSAAHLRGGGIGVGGQPSDERGELAERVVERRDAHVSGWSRRGRHERKSTRSEALCADVND
eukprot:5608562-Prymnesium_polylepis.1